MPTENLPQAIVYSPVKSIFTSSDELVDDSVQSGGDSEWILSSGFWNDAATWNDASTWIDGD